MANDHSVSRGVSRSDWVRSNRVYAMCTCGRMFTFASLSLADSRLLVCHPTISPVGEASLPSLFLTLSIASPSVSSPSHPYDSCYLCNVFLSLSLSLFFIISLFLPWRLRVIIVSTTSPHSHSSTPLSSNYFISHSAAKHQLTPFCHTTWVLFLPPVKDLIKNFTPLMLSLFLLSLFGHIRGQWPISDDQFTI